MPIDPQLRVHLIRHARNQIGKPDQTVADMLIVQMADELDQRVRPNYPSDFHPEYEPVAGQTPLVPPQSPADAKTDPAQAYGLDGESAHPTRSQDA
jgi:hypothetical protein